MNNLKTTLLFPLLISSILLTGCNEDTLNSLEASADETIEEKISALPLEAISSEEEASLLFMREEEKLARDVYLHLYAIWNLNIFNNIADSEQQHTNAVLLLLNRYQIADPVGSNDTGVFVDQSLQALYDALIASGSISLIDGLLAGTTIEETDILDIEQALLLVDNQDIKLVYESLLKGSRNHLRAYVRQLANQGLDYTPQYLSQQAYDAIINTPTETGR
ncbi:MAG: DUF2202 domain-containing protein [Gammaproteobacteria bacterium]|nr:DUF2202 domain-containing protein [Gammaproteobacteria bacterium]